MVSKSFLDADEAHRLSKDFMCCPCRICGNNKEFSRRDTLHMHLYEKGFMNNCTLWTKHDESGVLMGDDDNNNIADWAHLYEVSAFEDEPMDEAEENNALEQPPAN